jgi:hypothetical protein
MNTIVVEIQPEFKGISGKLRKPEFQIVRESEFRNSETQRF